MTSNDGRIRIAVLCGSVRPGNYTRMAADVVVASLSADPDVSVDVVDPSELDLPLPGLKAASDSVSELQEVIRRATGGGSLATPEYHGSFFFQRDEAHDRESRLPFGSCTQVRGASRCGRRIDRRHQVPGAATWCMLPRRSDRAARPRLRSPREKRVQQGRGVPRRRRRGPPSGIG